MIVDVLILTILIISVIVCFKKGIVRSVFNAVSAVLSFVLMAVLYKPVSAAFKSSDFGKGLYADVHDRVSQALVTSGNNAVAESELPEFIKSFLYSGAESAAESIASMTDKIMDVIVAIVAFIVLLIVIKLVFKLVPAVLEFLTKLPVLKQANKLLGGVAGIAVGLVWSVVAVYVVGLLSLLPSLEFLNEQIASSAVMEFLHTSGLGKLLF